jgi:hypothetical protein
MNRTYVHVPKLQSIETGCSCYTHPSKEVLKKTAIYHLINIFWTLSESFGRWKAAGKKLQGLLVSASFIPHCKHNNRITAIML